MLLIDKKEILYNTFSSSKSSAILLGVAHSGLVLLYAPCILYSFILSQSNPSKTYICLILEKKEAKMSKYPWVLHYQAHTLCFAQDFGKVSYQKDLKLLSHIPSLCSKQLLCKEEINIIFLFFFTILKFNELGYQWIPNTELLSSEIDISFLNLLQNSILTHFESRQNSHS